MKIPKNFDKIKLKNYAAYMALKGEKAETLEARLDLLYRRGAALLGVSKEEIRALTTGEQSDLMRLLTKPMPSRLMLQFRLNGIRYRPIIDARQIDGKRYAGIKLAASRGIYPSLHQIMFLLCCPVKFGFKKQFPFVGWKPYEFEVYEIEGRINDFKELPAEVFSPVSGFFLTLSKELNALLSDYSNSELQRMTAQVNSLRADLEADTDF